MGTPADGTEVKQKLGPKPSEVGSGFVLGFSVICHWMLLVSAGGFVPKSHVMCFSCLEATLHG